MSTKATKSSNKPSKKKQSRKQPKWLRWLARPKVARWFAVAAALIVLATTVFWAILGARLQQENADQLVDGYFFENGQAFRGADFPSQHTFLLKWPLFWLMKLGGFSGWTFAASTIALTLVTVGFLALILWRIERRPWMFGALCLALASTLLLVPAVPYAGALLPVNLAMTTTRNLEYVLYITSIYLLVRTSKLRQRQFWLAVGLLALVIASDKLFLVLGAGSGLLLWAVYWVAKRQEMVQFARRWLLATVAGALLASGALALLNVLHLTHIVGQSAAGPYGLDVGSRDILWAGWNAVLAFLTNFGANPAFEARTYQAVPGLARHHLLSIGGLSFVVNAAVVLGGLCCAVRLVRDTFARPSPKKRKQKPLDQPTVLSLALLASTVAAGVAFVATKHYYPVDARYLSIGYFAIFITAATYVRRLKLPKQLPKLIVSAGVLVVSVGLAVPAALHLYQTDQATLRPLHDRNAVLAQVLAHHPVDVLVGDYWRVVPTKFAAGSQLRVMPLSDCTTARTSLTSEAWKLDLAQHSFAYLLTLEPGLTDFPPCNLDAILEHFGRPNASTVLAGSLDHPRELLLFYDHGIQKFRPTPPGAATTHAIFSPIDLQQLPGKTCATSTTLNVVAHQDDDLLFMSPDLQNEIAAGNCVRTLYITAGDDGADKFYWLSREQGSEAAYSEMLDQSSLWIQKTVKLADGQFLTAVTPRGNPRVTLLFMRLPDGDLQGKGFRASHHESLEQLETNMLPRIHAVDDQSSYTSEQLTAALVALMQAYQPSEIHTQADVNASGIYPDHSDHLAVGRLVSTAYEQYRQELTATPQSVPQLTMYVGYPVRAWEPNVIDPELERKTAAFLAYAKFDGGVCQNVEQCQYTPTYGSYLTRQYPLTEELRAALSSPTSHGAP